MEYSSEIHKYIHDYKCTQYTGILKSYYLYHYFKINILWYISNTNVKENYHEDIVYEKTPYENN